MRALGIKFGLAATAAILACPSVAAAQQVLPPGNSAVNQYTESVPTAKGNAKVKHRADRRPAKVIGSRNAHRLEAAGPQGQATAEVAAATAPARTVDKAAPSRNRGQGPAGSSGLRKVIAEATGSSDSGELGLLLPLLILCALAGSAVYAWRRYRRQAV
jgi:hypothetical protein